MQICAFLLVEASKLTDDKNWGELIRLFFFSVRSRNLFYPVLQERKHWVKKLRKKRIFFFGVKNSKSFPNMVISEFYQVLASGYNGLSLCFFREKTVICWLPSRYQIKAEIPTVTFLYRFQFSSSTIRWNSGFPSGYGLYPWVQVPLLEQASELWNSHISLNFWTQTLIFEQSSSFSHIF